jgi:hypothetical protein
LTGVADILSPLLKGAMKFIICECCRSHEDLSAPAIYNPLKSAGLYVAYCTSRQTVSYMVCLVCHRIICLQLYSFEGESAL